MYRTQGFMPAKSCSSSRALPETHRSLLFAGQRRLIHNSAYTFIHITYQHNALARRCFLFKEIPFQIMVCFVIMSFVSCIHPPYFVRTFFVCVILLLSSTPLLFCLRHCFANYVIICALERATLVAMFCFFLYFFFVICALERATLVAMFCFFLLLHVFERHVLFCNFIYFMG